MPEAFHAFSFEKSIQSFYVLTGPRPTAHNKVQVGVNNVTEIRAVDLGSTTNPQFWLDVFKNGELDNRVRCDHCIIYYETS